MSQVKIPNNHFEYQQLSNEKENLKKTGVADQSLFCGSGSHFSV
jgi:hypothetical protein